MKWKYLVFLQNEQHYSSVCFSGESNCEKINITNGSLPSNGNEITSGWYEKKGGKCECRRFVTLNCYFQICFHMCVCRSDRRKQLTDWRRCFFFQIWLNERWTMENSFCSVEIESPKPSRRHLQLFLSFYPKIILSVRRSPYHMLQLLDIGANFSVFTRLQ